jgi:ribosomal protein L23
MRLTDVIKRPLITEKTTLLREGNRTVVFEVAANATKVDIKHAVEKLLNAKVEGVGKRPGIRYAYPEVQTHVARAAVSDRAGVR